MKEINDKLIEYINQRNPENPIIMSLHDLNEINVKLEKFLNSSSTENILIMNFGQKVMKNIDNNWQQIEIIMNNNQYYLLNHENDEKIEINKMNINKIKANNKDIFPIEQNILYLAMSNIKNKLNLKPNNTLKI